MMPGWLAGTILFTILGLLVGSQIYWFRRARRFVRSRSRAWQRWLAGAPLFAWFALLGVLFVAVPFRWILLTNLGNPPVLLSLFTWLRQPALMIPVGLWIWSSVLSFLLIALVQSIGWLVRLVRRAGKPEEVSVARRHFLQTATYAAGAVPFVMVGYGFLIGRRNYTVEEVAISYPNLPAPLDGLRLLLLTDLHASAYMPIAEVRRVVGLARELEADLVFHTGDFTTSRGDPLEEAVAELARVEGRYGAFGCLGNHEIYAGTEAAATELFARRGVRILRGRNSELEINGAKLNVIGVDYLPQPRSFDPAVWRQHFLRGGEALVRPGAFNILLTHNPNPFVRAADLGIPLTLAGHTHGGQVQVEILNSRWSPPRFFTPYVSGLYDSSSPVHEAQGTKHAFLYVSRGLGTIAAPVRLNAPPEITLLALRRSV